MKIYCPKCKQIIELSVSVSSCPNCKKQLMDAAGVFDLVSASAHDEEREFYDDVYSKPAAVSQERLTIESVANLWRVPDCPEIQLVFNEMQNLKGKTILLLGNGESVKELMLLTMNPYELVYSDLSMHGLAKIKSRYDLSAYKNHITFASVDAEDIPFVENSFDVVYGFAMVHHLPDLDHFIKEAVRVLKPGGYAVFMDDAYAPIWHYSKQTFLKPLMKYSHRRTGISPEDYRFSMSGGFKEKNLSASINGAGGEPWFNRVSLLTYIFYRGLLKLTPSRVYNFFRNPGIAKVITGIDRLVCSLPGFKQNQIRLVWGLKKPAQ